MYGAMWVVGCVLMCVLCVFLSFILWCSIDVIVHSCTSCKPEIESRSGQFSFFL